MFCDIFTRGKNTVVWKCRKLEVHNVWSSCWIIIGLSCTDVAGQNSNLYEPVAPQLLGKHVTKRWMWRRKFIMRQRLTHRSSSPLRVRLKIQNKNSQGGCMFVRAAVAHCVVHIISCTHPRSAWLMTKITFLHKERKEEKKRKHLAAWK